MKKSYSNIKKNKFNQECKIFVTLKTTKTFLKEIKDINKMET